MKGKIEPVRGKIEWNIRKKWKIDNISNFVFSEFTDV